MDSDVEYYDEFPEEEIGDEYDEPSEIGDFIFSRKEEKTSERKNCIVGHLCAPINENDALFLLNNDIKMFKGCKRHLRLKRKMIKSAPVYHIADLTLPCGKDPIGYLQRWIKLEHVCPKIRLKLMKYSLRNFLLHKMDFLKPIWRKDDSIKELLLSDNTRITKQVELELDKLEEPLADMMKAEKIKDTICFKDIIEGNCINYRGLSAEPDVSFLKDPNGSTLVFSTNLLLCALDKLQCRFNVLLYMKIADIKDKYEGVSMFEYGSKLISEFEKLRSKLGNDFYEVMNAYESLIVGWVVAAEDDLGCTDLFTTSYGDICDVLDKHHLDRSIIDNILPPFRSTSITKMFIELTGLVKTMGYPILDAESTLEHILKYGTESDPAIDMNHMDHLEGVLRKKIATNFYRKYNRLPVIVECPKSLYCLVQGKLPKESVDDLEWKKVKFGKSLTYDYSPDQADLIKDSSAAVSRDAWSRMYDPCAFRVKYNKDPPVCPKSLYPTRVILDYLNASPDDVRNFVTQRDLGILNPQDHIYVECQKECELNKVGRAFTKQTPPQRLIQTSMEHNIADNIFPLVPEQSMVDSEIKNLRRHLQQVKEMKASAQFINIDLKKWCLHHRHISTKFVGKVYDELFGLVSLYTVSHLFSNGCWVFPNHRLCPPDFDSAGNPIESHLFTRMFIGGMEGMQQKKWTHGAIANIQYVAEACGVTCEIMAQGDNIVILLIFSKDDPNASIKRSNFLKQLELSFRKMGHKLKEKETWYSGKLHEYSKQRMYEGCSVSFALKKCSKLIPDINDGLFSIPSSLSTINTITEGISRADYDPDIGFILNGINIINYLDRRNMVFDKSPSGVMTLLNWPVDFGGLNVSNYHSHAIRGNDDKVTIWLSFLETLGPLDDSLRENLLRVWILYPSSPAQNPMQRKNLYEDIFSLNIPQHPSAEYSIKEKVVKFLKSDAVTNPSIRYLYDSDHSLSYDSIIQEVDNIHPSYPPLIHEMLKNSNAGLLLRLQGKLSKSKTLEKIVNQEKGYSLVALINEKNQQMVESLRGRLSRNQSVRNKEVIKNHLFCPSDIANQLRTLSWGRDLIGVTKAPWMHQCLVVNQDRCSPAEMNQGITVRVSGSALDFPALCHKIYGPMRPFIGSKTKEKVTKSTTLSIQEKTNSAKAYLRIVKIEGWMSRLGDKAILDFVQRLKTEKEGVFSQHSQSLLDDHQNDEMAVEGNLFHRFKSSIERDTAMVNSLPSVTGHFEYSSNSMKDLTAGGKDFSVFYQYIYTSCTEALAMVARVTGKLHPGYMILFNDCKCFVETPNPRMSMLNSNSFTPAIMMEEEVADVVMNVDHQTIKRSFSAHLGCQLALNIDNNYYIAHCQKGTDNQANEYKKEQISINDMRQIEFSICLNHAFFLSSHCRDLFNNSHRLLLCFSEDRSFLYLAELILESDLVPSLISKIGVRPNEHGGITSIFGISSYISKNVSAYMRLVATAPDPLVFVRFRNDKDMFLLACVKKIKNILERCKLLNKRDSETLQVELTSTNNLRRIYKALPVDYLYEPMSTSEVVRSWKMSDRGVDITPDVNYKNVSPNPPDQFPFFLVQEYHQRREISSLTPRIIEVDRVKVPQLSFICRRLGSISSAANKALETLVATGVYFDLVSSPCHVICTAEGSGSILLSLYASLPLATFSYNTWMRPDISHRDKATDVCVPALVDMNLDPSRLLDDKSLITGETDILQEEFLKKLFKVIDKYGAALITMDAESPVESNNLQFLSGFVVPILKKHLCYFLVKLFHMIDLKPLIEQILGQFEGLIRWVIYKPISSNPVGPEVYLVIAPKRECLTNSFANCIRLQPKLRGYIGTSMAMDKEDVDIYVRTARSVGLFLKSFFPNNIMDLPHRYQQASGFCSLLCPRFFDKCLMVVDEVHCSDGDMLVYLATRSKGTNSVILGLIHDLVFLCLYHNLKVDQSFFKLFFFMSRLKINGTVEDIRRNYPMMPLATTPPNEGDLWATWKDGRIFLRELGNHPMPCSCVPTPRVWTWDLTVRFNPLNSMSFSIYSSLVTLGAIKSWEPYLSLRKEPIKASNKKQKNAICNASHFGIPSNREDFIRN